MKKKLILIVVLVSQINFAQNSFPSIGSVGIGTTSPSQVLDVRGSGIFNGMIMSSMASEIGGQLRLINGSKTVAGAASTWTIYNMTGGYGNSLQFWAYDNSSCGGGLCSNRFTIMDNGNIGIGIHDPNNKLEVVADEFNTLEAAGFYNTTAYGNVNNKSETRINIGKIEQNARQPMGAIGAFPAYNTDSSNGNLALYTRENQLVIERVRIKSNGNVGIGTINPTNKLDVNGTIHSKEVKVDMDNWSDFVLKKEYTLPTLEEVERHIGEKGHLENIPSEKEVLENGINLGEMNAKLLQKIEEMTLYMIEQNKQIIDLKYRLEKVEINSK